MQVDPQEDEWPEEDREDRRQHPAPAVEVLEVVVRRRDRHADTEVDQADQTDTPASPHGYDVPRASESKTRWTSGRSCARTRRGCASRRWPRFSLDGTALFTKPTASGSSAF